MVMQDMRELSVPFVVTAMSYLRKTNDQYPHHASNLLLNIDIEELGVMLVRNQVRRDATDKEELSRAFLSWYPFPCSP